MYFENKSLAIKWYTIKVGRHSNISIAQATQALKTTYIF